MRGGVFLHTHEEVMAGCSEGQRLCILYITCHCLLAVRVCGLSCGSVCVWFVLRLCVWCVGMGKEGGTGDKFSI